MPSLSSRYSHSVPGLIFSSPLFFPPYRSVYLSEHRSVPSAAAGDVCPILGWVVSSYSGGGTLRNRPSLLYTASCSLGLCCVTRCNPRGVDGDISSADSIKIRIVGIGLFVGWMRRRRVVRIRSDWQVSDDNEFKG